MPAHVPHLSRIATLAVGAVLLAMPSTRAAEDVDAAVLAAEQRRIDVIARASRAAVAVFAGPGGGGSAVLVDPSGYALTNFHVVQPAGPTLRCGLDDGRLYDAVLVGLDPTGDVALVKLLGRDDFPCVTLADSDAVVPGDWCFAAGNPFLLATDLRPSISAGIVSGVHRYQFPAGTILEYTDCLQVDAAINPGNSGGGLFDAAGRLIGVNGRASFEKRGRVNVGVGYAISANQLRRFLGALRGGRLVDHASLGATVATDVDGRVVVSDVAEASDAWRRGLRPDDEIVALAGRPVRTVNAFKNVLGTLPAEWQVPVAYRRDGRPHEALVRLVAVHAPARLAALAAGGAGEDPDAPDPEARPAAEVPAPIRAVWEPRVGFANYHFNLVERERVARAIAATPAATAAGPWELAGTLGDGAACRIVLDDARATIDLPTGASEIDPRGDLDRRTAPAGSGGLLAALALWQRLVRDGPAALGGTTYLGTAPARPERLGMEGAPATLVDVLESHVAGVTARFAVDAAGNVVAIDVWSAPDADPCEVRLEPPRSGDPRGMPEALEVRRGTEPFATITLAPPPKAADAP